MDIHGIVMVDITGTMGHPGARSLAELVNITRELLVAVTVKAILAVTYTYFYHLLPTISYN